MTANRTSSRIAHLIRSSLVWCVVRGVSRLVTRLCPVVVIKNTDTLPSDQDRCQVIRRGTRTGFYLLLMASGWSCE